jgi:hypothetical protein
LNNDENDTRGRPARKRHADKMIENRHSENRHLGEPRKPSAAIDEARLRQQAIGVRLRQMFDEVVNEAVPDEFLEILRRGDSKAENS